MRDYSDDAHAYADAVLAGDVVACDMVRLACERFLGDIKRAKTDKVTFPYHYDGWYASDFCGFAEKMPHIEGEWDTPTITLEPWQAFLFCNVFGWRRNSDEGRRFNTVYVEVARKNTKSTLTAPVGLYGLACEGEKGPQVKIAATTRAQCEAVFNPMKRMAELTPDFMDAFEIEVRAHSILCHSNNGKAEPLNSKASSQDSHNPHVSIIDELHAHKTRALFDVLKSARGARKNPLLWLITTAGFNLEGVCYEQRQMLAKILQGTIENPAYFGLIYTLDEGDDWKNPAVWPKANPMLGISVQREELAQVIAEAEASPASQGEVKTKRLNQWLGSADAWLDLEKWDACADPTLNIEDFAGEECFLTGDLASRDDLISLIAVFEREDVLYAFAWYWLPRDLIADCSDRSGEHYEGWAKEGLIELIEGDMVSYAPIKKKVDWLADTYNVREISFDPYQSNELLAALGDEGYECASIGYTMKHVSDPAKDIEARVKVGKLRHSGHKILRWNAANCVVWRDEKGGILPKKENKHSPQKVDGMVALCIANGRRLKYHESSSGYEGGALVAA